MTTEQIRKAKLLNQCTYLPGSFEKRFARAMAGMAEHKPEMELTEKQDGWLSEQFYRYRNQIMGHDVDKRVKNLLKEVPKNPLQKTLLTLTIILFSLSLHAQAYSSSNILHLLFLKQDSKTWLKHSWVYVLHDNYRTDTTSYLSDKQTLIRQMKHMDTTINFNKPLYVHDRSYPWDSCFKGPGIQYRVGEIAISLWALRDTSHATQTVVRWMNQNYYMHDAKHYWINPAKSGAYLKIIYPNITNGKFAKP